LERNNIKVPCKYVAASLHWCVIDNSKILGVHMGMGRKKSELKMRRRKAQSKLKARVRKKKLSAKSAKK
jgi:hypothetical protein